MVYTPPLAIPKAVVSVSGRPVQQVPVIRTADPVPRTNHPLQRGRVGSILTV